MGMDHMFSNNADFSGISTAEPLKISKVIQKAFMEVGEEGTEAAAATDSLLQKTTLLNAKIYNVLLEIQARLVSMGVAPVVSEAPQADAAIHEMSFIYQSWVKKLPLREVHRERFKTPERAPRQRERERGKRLGRERPRRTAEFIKVLHHKMLIHTIYTKS